MKYLGINQDWYETHFCWFWIYYVLRVKHVQKKYRGPRMSQKTPRFPIRHQGVIRESSMSQDVPKSTKFTNTYPRNRASIVCDFFIKYNIHHSLIILVMGPSILGPWPSPSAIFCPSITNFLVPFPGTEDRTNWCLKLCPNWAHSLRFARDSPGPLISPMNPPGTLSPGPKMSLLPIWPQFHLIQGIVPPPLQLIFASPFFDESAQKLEYY